MVRKEEEEEEDDCDDVDGDSDMEYFPTSQVLRSD